MFRSSVHALAHPQIQGLCAELTQWPGAVLNSHKSATQLFHKLTFIADLGLQVGDPPVQTIIADQQERYAPELV